MTQSQRNPTTFFTAERKSALEDMTGTLPSEHQSFLEMVGERSAKLWPTLRYNEINDPSNGHHVFLEAIDTFIDTDKTGLRGSFLPAEIGGQDIPFPVYMTALEMVAQGNASVALSLAIDGSVLNSIWKLNENESTRKPGQIERYVTDALTQKKMTAFALTEPGVGSDAGNLATKATATGDFYTFNGEKTWITNAGWADYYFAVVRTNPDKSLGPLGVSIIMVHKDEISSIVQIPKYTVPGSFTATLAFNDSVVPVSDGVERLVGEKDTGFNKAKDLLAGGRVTIAAYGLGIAQEALEGGLDYSRNRISRGVPIINHQAIGFPFAEASADITAARYLMLRAAKLMGSGKLDQRQASEAKYLANRVANAVTHHNLESHGGYGLSKEYRAMQLFHDARVGVTGEGTAQVQLGIILSKLK